MDPNTGQKTSAVVSMLRKLMHVGGRTHDTGNRASVDVPKTKRFDTAPILKTKGDARPIEQIPECYLYRLPQELRDEIYSYLVQELPSLEPQEWRRGGANLPILKITSTRAPLPQMLLLNHRLTEEYLAYVAEPQVLNVSAKRVSMGWYECLSPETSKYLKCWPRLPPSCRRVRTCIVDYYTHCGPHKPEQYHQHCYPGFCNHDHNSRYCTTPENLSLLGGILESDFLPQMFRLQSVKLRVWIMTQCAGQSDWERFEGRHFNTPLLRSLEALTDLPNLVELEMMMFRGDEPVEQWATGDVWHYTLGAWHRDTGLRAAALKPLFEMGGEEYSTAGIREQSLGVQLCLDGF